MRYRRPKKTVVAALRLPEDLYIRVMEEVESEDLDFSKFVRRAIRKDMKLAGMRRIPSR